jgi:hypothetical protein
MTRRCGFFRARCPRCSDKMLTVAMSAATGSAGAPDQHAPGTSASAACARYSSLQEGPSRAPCP